MSKIYVANHISFDGVMQSPGRPDEDTRGGFSYGGWAEPGSTNEVLSALQKRVVQAGGLRLLLGRRSYSDMLSHWNKMGGEFTDGLNSAQKYVVSRSSAASLPWPNSTLVTGDVPRGVAALKADSGPDLCIMGSGQLIHTLLKHKLLDELLLFVHPLILGSGLRIFPDGGAAHKLELLNYSVANNGVCVQHYRVG